MKQKSNVLLPKILGYLGLLPFVIPTFFLFYDYHHLEMWRHFLITYAAIILSFVGALHWSFAMLLHDLPANKQKWSFIWSVIPSLAAWVALSIPQFYSFFLLATFFILNLIKDKTLSNIVELPNWYISLRHNLTFVATACLVVSGLLFRAGHVMFSI
jgi:hypothetical protein